MSTVGYKGKVTMANGFYYAGVAPALDTWQRYLSRLGGGINGVLNAGGTENFTEEDIVNNANKYMQEKYPGNYRVESYYNVNKMKWDLRLRFDDPREETMWLLRWS